MFTSRRLDDHIKQCSDRHGETLERIADLSEQTRGEFAAVKDDVERRHKESATRFNHIESLLWKAALGIIAALAAQYLAAHGFKAPFGG